MATAEEKAAPAADRQAVHAREFFGSFLKGLRRLAIYRHDPARFPEFLMPAHQALSACLSAGPLVIDVEPERLSLRGQALLPEGTPETLALELHRDGVRQLVFRPEASLEELVTFSLIAAGEGGARRGADLQAALWAASMPHVGYVAVKGLGLDAGGGGRGGGAGEGLGAGSPAEQLVRGLGQQAVAAVAVGIEADVGDFGGVEPPNMVTGEGEGITTAQLEDVQRELAEDERLVWGKLADIVVKLLTDQLLANPGDQLLQIIDALLARGDFAAVRNLLGALGGPATAELRGSVEQRLADPERLAKVLDLLRGPPAPHPADLGAYLQALPPGVTLPALLEALDGIAEAENRRLAVDVLVALSAGNPAPFEPLLASDRPGLARDALAVLDRLDLPGKARFFTRAMQNPHAEARLEALGLIAASQTAGARSFLVGALADASPEVRARAARALVEADPAAAARELTRVAQAPEFGKRSAKERGALYAALAASGQPDALRLLAGVLQKGGGLFGKKAAGEEKALAIAALAEAGSIAGFKLLEAFVRDNASEGPEVLGLARKAMHDIQKALRGGR